MRGDLTSGAGYAHISQNGSSLLMNLHRKQRHRRIACSVTHDLDWCKHSRLTLHSILEQKSKRAELYESCWHSVHCHHAVAGQPRQPSEFVLITPHSHCHVNGSCAKQWKVSERVLERARRTWHWRHCGRSCSFHHLQPAHDHEGNRGFCAMQASAVESWC